jgi:aryl-alcohol dehydrogenase-like predicted oxidoreductase
MQDLGVRVIDTADSYGSGDCERLLGKVLKNRRENFTVVTKAGYRLSDLRGPLRPLNQFVKKALQKMGRRQCFDPHYLSRCMDRSLSRLRTEHVDAFLLHDPPLEAIGNDDVLRACAGFMQSGKARLTGVSSGNPAVVKAAIAAGIFRVVQTPANLGVATILEPLWSQCEAGGIHVMGNHVFSPKCLAHAGVMHATLMRGSAALLPATATVLCGTRNPAHLRQSNEWVRNPLPVVEARQLAQALMA